MILISTGDHAAIAVVISILIIASGLNLSGADPCQNHMILNNWLRSSGNKVSSSASYFLCDSYLLKGWYRLTSKAGSEMPTACVPKFSCGTEYPIWMNGNHPNSMSDGVVTREVCATDDPCSSVNIDCWNINVKKCEVNNGTSGQVVSYYVYQLTPSYSCDMAYCAGNGKPCPAGTNSKTGFTPNCTRDFPNITERVTLEAVAIVTAKRTELRCKTATDATEENAKFNFTWFTVDAAGRADRFFSDIVAASSSGISSRLGSRCARNSEGCYSGKKSYTFRCSVKGYFLNSAIQSPSKISNDVFIGIRISKSVIHLHHLNEIARFEVTRTLPVFYKNSRCNALRISIKDVGLNAIGQCSVSFHGSTAFNETQKFELSQRVSGRPQKTEYYIKLKVDTEKCQLDWSELSKGETKTKIPLVPMVKIMFLGSTIQHRQGQCRVTSDPRIVTFDNAKRSGTTDIRSQNYYKIRSVGYFILAQNKDQEFEVHIWFKECGGPGSLSCTCGFAVWERNEFVIIDYCKTNKNNPRQAPILQAQIYSASKTKSATKVSKTTGKSNSITVTMPSGAQLEADLMQAGNPNTRQSWSLDVFVKVFEENTNKMDGLCGNFDDDSSNDIPSGGYGDDAAKKYWIPKEKSIFRNYKTLSINKACQKETLYCKCEEDPNVEGQYTFGDCDTSKVKDSSDGRSIANVQKTCFDSRRKRRSTDGQLNIVNWYTPEDVDVPDNRTVNFTVLTWPTASGINKTIANNICKNKIQETGLWDVCSSMKGVDVSRSIDTCVDDIKNLDDADAAVSTAIEDIQQTCKFAIDGNVSLWITNSTNGTQSLTRPDAILSKICPNQCSLRGNCTNGVCTCLPKFRGFDCSSEIGKIPTLTGIADATLCNVRNGSCSSVTLIGEDFADTANLTCLSRNKSVQSTKTNKAIDSTQIVMVSKQQAICTIAIRTSNQYSDHVEGSSSSPMRISVSNDRNKFSNNLQYHVYDSLCQSCSSFGNCVQVDGTCSINGYCFVNGNANPSNWCLVCNTTESKPADKWMERKDNKRPSIKLNISNEAVVLEGGNVTILVQADDPESRPMNVSYSSDLSTFNKLVGSILTIGPVFDQINLTVIVVDQCGLNASVKAMIKPKRLPKTTIAEKDSSTVNVPVHISPSTTPKLGLMHSSSYHTVKETYSETPMLRNSYSTDSLSKRIYQPTTTRSPSYSSSPYDIKEKTFLDNVSSTVNVPVYIKPSTTPKLGLMHSSSYHTAKETSSETPMLRNSYSTDSLSKRFYQPTTTRSPSYSSSPYDIKEKTFLDNVSSTVNAPVYINLSSTPKLGLMHSSSYHTSKETSSETPMLRNSYSIDSLSKRIYQPTTTRSPSYSSSPYDIKENTFLDNISSTVNVPVHINPSTTHKLGLTYSSSYHTVKETSSETPMLRNSYSTDSFSKRIYQPTTSRRPSYPSSRYDIEEKSFLDKVSSTVNVPVHIYSATTHKLGLIYSSSDRTIKEASSETPMFQNSYSTARLSRPTISQVMTGTENAMNTMSPTGNGQSLGTTTAIPNKKPSSSDHQVTIAIAGSVGGLIVLIFVIYAIRRFTGYQNTVQITTKIPRQNVYINPVMDTENLNDVEPFNMKEQ